MEYFRVAEPRPCVSPQKDSQEVQCLLPFLRAFPSFGGHGCSAKRRGELAAMTWPYSTHMGLSQNWGRRMDSCSLESANCLNQFLPEIVELCQTMVYSEFESQFWGSWFRSSISGNIPYFFYRRVEVAQHVPRHSTPFRARWRMAVGGQHFREAWFGAWDLDLCDDDQGNPGYCMKTAAFGNHQEWGCRPTSQKLNLERKLIKEVLEWTRVIYLHFRISSGDLLSWLQVDWGPAVDKFDLFAAKKGGTCQITRKSPTLSWYLVWLQRNGKTQQGWCAWANFHYRLIST